MSQGMVVPKQLQNHLFHFKGIKVSVSRKKSCKTLNKRVPAFPAQDIMLYSPAGDAANDSQEAQQVFKALDPVSRLLWSQALRSMH